MSVEVNYRELRWYTFFLPITICSKRPCGRKIHFLAPFSGQTSFPTAIHRATVLQRCHAAQSQTSRGVDRLIASSDIFSDGDMGRRMRGATTVPTAERYKASLSLSVAARALPSFLPIQRGV